MICRACGSTPRRHQSGLKWRKCHLWACGNACARDVVDLQCCRMSDVASHESQSQSCSQGLGSSAAEGAPRLTQGMEQETGVQMSDAQIAAVQSGPRPLGERVAFRATLQEVSTALSAMIASPMEVENVQPLQIDLATPRACQEEPQSSAQAPDPEAVFTWSEEKLLELTTSLPAMRTIGHQPRGLRQRRAQYSRSCCNITRIVITNGSSDAILNPSRLRLLQPSGRGWVSRRLYGPMRGANMRVVKN